MGLGAILDVVVIVGIRMLLSGVEPRSLLRDRSLQTEVRVKGNRSFVQDVTMGRIYHLVG